jgi:hypothetical protein
VANNGACLFPGDANGQCCSGKCGFNFRCTPALKGEVCQSNAGCTPGTTCINGRCN